MKFRYRSPFISLRWQVAFVLVASSTLAVLALLYWASAESKDDLNRRILLEQQHLISELRNTSRQGFNLLEERAKQLQAVLPLTESEASLQKLAYQFQASLFDDHGHLLAGRPAPQDSKAQQWLAMLLKNGGEYRRWHCQRKCELQYYSINPRGIAKLSIQHIYVDELMDKLDITYAANAWLIAPQTSPASVFYQTAPVPTELLQHGNQLPMPPNYLLFGPQRSQAMWRWPLQNDGIPAELWIAMPTEQAIADVQQVWRKTTWFIIITLGLCCAIALGLIWRPLLRLSQQATFLPTLANASNSKSPLTANSLLRDESHLLAGACQELSDKLNDQRQQLMEQTNELQRLAQHDQLTGLNNRAMFEQSLQQTIGHLGRHIQSLAVMFMDLNKFKAVNDTLGHEQGDHLLQQVAMRLAAVIRKTDVLARFGGDEFVILLTEPGDKQQLQTLANKLIEVVSDPIPLVSEVVQVGLSIGITTCHDPQCSISQLLREADTAMYAAKHTGTSKACFYNAALEQQQSEEDLLEIALQQAFIEQRLELRFMPMVNLKQNQVEHFQAVIHWPNAPESIPHANHLLKQISSASLRQKIQEWLLQSVLDALETCQSQIPSGRVFLSLTGNDLQQPEILRQLVLYSRQKPSVNQSLGLFIDELDYIEYGLQAQMELTMLFQQGVALALDHFGNALGALNHLPEFSPSLIRLDQQFCQNPALTNGVTESLIKMMNKMQVQTVACTATEQSYLELLKHLNCGLVQSCHFSNSISVNKLTGTNLLI